MVEHPEPILERDTVSVLAFDAEKNVLMAVQYRPNLSQLSLEMPSATAREDGPAEPIGAAKEALLKTVGYNSPKFTYLLSIPAGPYSTARRHLVLAEDCYKDDEAVLPEEDALTPLPVDSFIEHILPTYRSFDVGLLLLGLKQIELL